MSGIEYRPKEVSTVQSDFVNFTLQKRQKRENSGSEFKRGIDGRYLQKLQEREDRGILCFCCEIHHFCESESIAFCSRSYEARAHCKLFPCHQSGVFTLGTRKETKRNLHWAIFKQRDSFYASHPNFSCRKFPTNFQVINSTAVRKLQIRNRSLKEMNDEYIVNW